MHGLFGGEFWYPTVLSLIVLMANIGAPFHSSATGLAFPINQRQNAATSPVIRARAIAPSGASDEFPALIGLAKGGPDPSDPGSEAPALSAFLPSSTDTLLRRHGASPLVWLSPPLRC